MRNSRFSWITACLVGLGLFLLAESAREIFWPGRELKAEPSREAQLAQELGDLGHLDAQAARDEPLKAEGALAGAAAATAAFAQKIGGDHGVERQAAGPGAAGGGQDDEQGKQTRQARRVHGGELNLTGG